ncbi:hypothetical protein H0X48_01610 [Candidatus Dependentiae bacterium]|nr:hypothetical protein [Candidatus Dependentiae bacterium]
MSTVVRKSLWQSITVALCFFTFSVSLLSQPNPLYVNCIKQLVDKYTRPFTVLELGFTSTEYAFDIASTVTNVSCISIIFKDARSSLVAASAKRLNNIVVLNPAVASIEDLTTLGRCEHFDIVIIKELSTLVKLCGLRVITALCNLGDFIIFELPKNGTQLLKKIDSSKITVYNSCEGDIAVCTMHKQSLDIARWTQNLPVSSTPRYIIKSEFNQKLFYKDSAAKPTNWIRGINLVTFVMLKGIYPSDDTIRQQLTALASTFPEYNDGVIGNMIIDGASLKLIDFDDKRRKSNMKKCINKALRLFNNDKTRLVDPKKRIKEYYRSL